MPANGYIVLASDLEKFTSVHPTVTNVIGDFGFDFSNNSEELRLFDRNDQLYTSFIYSDQLPFPVVTNAGEYGNRKQCNRLCKIIIVERFKIDIAATASYYCNQIKLLF